MDHCIDPFKSILESLFILKPNGILHLKHRRAEGVFENYSSLHQWNIDYTDEMDFIIWNYDMAKIINKLIMIFADTNFNKVFYEMLKE